MELVCTVYDTEVSSEVESITQKNPSHPPVINMFRYSPFPHPEDMLSLDLIL